MPWSYTHNRELQIVEVVFSGEVTAADLHESTARLIALEKQQGVTRFLVDPTDMTLVASLAGVYDLPDKQ